MTWAAVLQGMGGWGGVVNAGISLLGASKAKKQEGQGMQAYQDGLKALMALVPPSLADLTAELAGYVQQGQITPEEFIAHLQEESEMMGIKIPDDVRNLQYETLNNLSEIVNEGGLTDIDKAKLNDIKGELQTNARGNALALQNEFAARGMSGSGTEMMARLANDAATNQAASKMGFDVAAEAQRRALDAIKMRGDYASNLRDQEVGEQERKAQAQDAINRFNTANLQNTSDRNVDAANAAQEANLRERQRIADSVVNAQNINAQNVATAHQQMFDNERNRLTPIVTQGNNVGTQQMAGAARTERQYNAIGGAIGDIIDEYGRRKKPTVAGNGGEMGPPREYAGVASDERVKVNVRNASEDEVGDIMDALTGKKFNYARGFKADPDDHIGIMAQDLEKTPGGAALVVEKDGVKHVDVPQATMLALAGIAQMNKRLKDKGI